MSWDIYAAQLVEPYDPNTKKSKVVGTYGYICGLDGTFWGKSPKTSGLAEAPDVTEADLQGVANMLKSPQPGQGLSIGGIKYMVLRNDGTTLVGKKGKGNLVCCKSTKSVLIAIMSEADGEGKAVPDMMAAVENFQKKLAEKGF